jgi:hypothetical protein
MSSKNVQNPKPNEKVCYNCIHLAWLIGIGQGLKCGKKDGQKIPSRWHTCEFFQSDVEPVKKKD